MKELLTKIDNDQEIYKTKKISEMQKELNSVLLKMKTPEIPKARHSMVDRHRAPSGRASYTTQGNQGRSSMLVKFKNQDFVKDKYSLDLSTDEKIRLAKRQFN